eukprot:gnl/MRDRNA2_/MRDRNA2_42841_c0_seq2.p1 gnl/MRDRNA2_/MRDRNA2_42841_c0~~gnl/MRDRNA2_/MRDRNA2_42841_c0_seq2.p1  ORF type:complete len:331 (-),score=40.49 gnl/MRDRNA2_/MRDRNA2_42841_c0_seq2:40-1032(-)
MAPLSFTELLDGIAVSHMGTETISGSKGLQGEPGAERSVYHVSQRVAASRVRPVTNASLETASSLIDRMFPVEGSSSSSSSAHGTSSSSTSQSRTADASKVGSFEHTLVASMQSVDGIAVGKSDTSSLKMISEKGNLEPRRESVIPPTSQEQNQVPCVLQGSSFMPREDSADLPQQVEMAPSSPLATGFVDQLFRDVEMPAHAPWMVQALRRGQAGEPALESSPRDRDATALAQRSAEPTPEKGIPAELLVQWPATRQRDGLRDKETCAVCLESLRRGQEVRRLPCSHPYHRSCIDPWLRNSTLCPCCKADVLPSLQTRLSQEAQKCLLY